MRKRELVIKFTDSEDRLCEFMMPDSWEKKEAFRFWQGIWTQYPDAKLFDVSPSSLQIAPEEYSV